MKRGLWAFVGFFTAITLLMAGSFSPVVLAQPAQQDVLRLDILPPGTLDPTLVSYSYEIQVINELFAGLVRLDPQTGAALPDLAQSWAWNAAKTEVTFTLRPGLVWSDGQPLTAEDARYGILRALDPLLQAPYASMLYPIHNAEGYNNGSITDPSLVGVYADTPATLRIVLNAPMVFFDKVMSLALARPLPEQAISAHPTNWTDPANIAVSGPYTLAEWTTGAIRLTQNASYYGPTPDVNQVDFLLTSDTDQTWKEYLLGNLDSTTLIPSKLPVVLADPVLSQQLHTYAASCTYVLVFNVDSAPFGSANVRKALTAAIDRQNWVSQGLGGVGLPTQTFSPPGMFGYVDGEALGIGIPSNAAQAQAYLATAGYPGGAGFPSVTVQVRDHPINHTRWDYFVNAWQSVLNITINVTYVASPPNNQPLQVFGWCADYSEAYNFVGDGVDFLQMTGRIGSWENAAYDALIEQIRQEENLANRETLYQQAEQDLVEDEAIIAPLWNTVNLQLVHPYLQRTYVFAAVDPIEAWVIETADSADYNPAAALAFDPAVDGTSYSLPAGLFSGARHLLHTTLRGPEIPAAPAGFGGIGLAFMLQAGVPAPTGPQQPADTLVPFTITVVYSPEQLTAADILAEADLELYAQVGLNWVQLNTTVDTVTHTLSASTTLMDTTFVVWGRNTNAVYLPVINRP